MSPKPNPFDCEVFADALTLFAGIFSSIVGAPCYAFGDRSPQWTPLNVGRGFPHRFADFRKAIAVIRSLQTDF